MRQKIVLRQKSVLRQKNVNKYFCVLVGVLDVFGIGIVYLLHLVYGICSDIEKSTFTYHLSTNY